MRLRMTLVALAALPLASVEARGSDEISAERGAYVAAVSGCHDCHSVGFAEAGGVADGKTALTGSPLGFRGPWGTTYPVNVRLYMSEMTEDEWVSRAREMKTRPPMPWFAVNMMEESDLRSLYRYVGELGEPGEPAPAALGPDEVPQTPVFQLVMEPPAKS